MDLEDTLDSPLHCSAWLGQADSLFCSVPDSQGETPENKGWGGTRSRAAAGRALLGETQLRDTAGAAFPCSYHKHFFLW